jgi:hypothetical protein
MLLRQYKYTDNSNVLNNTVINNSSYTDYQNSDFYELEGEITYD